MTSDDISADGRNTGGGYTLVLNNLFTQAKKYPHTVIEEGVGGATVDNGPSRVAKVLLSQPNAQYYLVQFGANATRGLFPTPSGQGLTSSDPRHPGT